MSDYEEASGQPAEMTAGRPVSAPEEQRSKHSSENYDASKGSRPEPLKQKPNFAAMRPHIDAGHDLVPLQGKVPMKGWRTRSYSRADIEMHVRGGGNAGVRLKATDLVIDVDPRNFDPGDDPLRRIAEDFRLNLDYTPLVFTGGGGRHYYFSKPAEVLVLNGLAAYPGVEFKSAGRQVVAAGSVHPETGKLYEQDALSPVVLSQAPSAPRELLTAIVRPAVENVDGGGQFTPAQLAVLLSGLDAEAFDNNEKWFPIMAAAHHATAGAGLDEFVEWCTSDARYRGHEHLIAGRWQSMNQARSHRPITVATLFKALSDAGKGEVIDRVTRVSAEEDFADAPPPEWPLAMIYKDKSAAKHARHFLKERPWPLICVNEEFFSFQNTRWRKITAEAVRAEVRRTDPGDQLDVPHLQTFVQGIRDLQNQDANPFGWLRNGWDEGRWPRGDRDPPAENVVAFSNGLLDTTTMRLSPPSPHYFTTAYTDYAYDHAATCPRWRAFLTDVLPEGAESVLQEWFGYNLVGDTRHHKFLVLVGAQRGGKGTIGRILRALVGEDNVAATDLATLNGDFGLQSLTLCKTAIIPDAHDVTHGARSNVLSRLKSITGGDAVPVNRKYLSEVTMTLPARFTMMANKVPRFTDDSGALASRMVVIRFQKSFLGKEDPDLTAKLRAELPGIANWALEGLKRLQAQGRFTETEHTRQQSDEVAMQQSPVRRFMEDRLDLSDVSAWTPMDLIYQAYIDWAHREGVRNTEDQAGLWTNINAVVPTLAKVQRRYKLPWEEKSRQLRGILGVRVVAQDEAEAF